MPLLRPRSVQDRPQRSPLVLVLLLCLHDLSRPPGRSGGLPGGPELPVPPVPRRRWPRLMRGFGYELRSGSLGYELRSGRSANRELRLRAPIGAFRWTRRRERPRHMLPTFVDAGSLQTFATSSKHRFREMERPETARKTAEHSWVDSRGGHSRNCYTTGLVDDTEQNETDLTSRGECPRPDFG